MFLWSILLLLSFSPMWAGEPSLPANAVNGTRLVNTKRIDIELDLKRMIPAEMTVEEGTYEIRLINTAYVTNLSMQLDDQSNGKHIGSREISAKSVKNRPIFDLKPGRHVLSIAGHPELTAVINVTKK
jgi:hypothetical protein